jgi:hypothetical protein
MDHKVQFNRDDHPFFYHKQEGVPVVLLISLAFIGFWVVLLLWKGRSSLRLENILYVSAIAIGYIMVEVTLV